MNNDLLVAPTDSAIELEFRELHLQNQKLQLALNELKKLILESSSASVFNKEFYTPEECAQIKGAAATSTFRCARFMLPGAGSPKYEAHVLGRLAFPRSEVIRWATVCDEDYEEYARSCGVTVIPPRFSYIKGGKAK